jgi:hypothetical protein
MTEQKKPANGRFEKEADALRKNLEKRRQQKQAREQQRKEKERDNGQD